MKVIRLLVFIGRTVWQGYPCLQTGAGMWQLRNKGHLALIMDTIPSFPIKEKQCVAIWSTFTFFEEKETRRKLLRAPFMTHGLATPVLNLATLNRIAAANFFILVDWMNSFAGTFATS